MGNGRLIGIYAVVFNFLFISLILFAREESKIIPYHLDFDIWGVELWKISMVVWCILFLFVRVLRVTPRKQLLV